MRISHKYKFVFIAVPRTASTTVRNLLDSYSDIKSIHITKTDDSFPFYHHITAKEVKVLFLKYGWNWDEYKKFCVIRNPYDRIVSLYHHMIKINSGGDQDRNYFYNFTKFLTSLVIPKPNFKVFVMNLKNTSKLNAPLTEYINDYNGEEIVDNILLYENLEFELQQFLKTLGIEISTDNIPITNKSKNRKNYCEYYSSKELIHKINQLYSYEFERFKYEF